MIQSLLLKLTNVAAMVSAALGLKWGQDKQVTWGDSTLKWGDE